MSTRVAHLFMVVSALNILSACSEDPCSQPGPKPIQCADEGAGDTGETGGDPDDEPGCAPFYEDELGSSYECQGTGNGWLELSVHPLGAQPVECVNWGDGGKPENPTIEDCVPLDLSELGDIPNPGACCLDGTEEAYITGQCESDCGFAACKLAVQKLRDAALALPENGPQGVVRDDLFTYASILEMPNILEKCADDLLNANGELTPILLGPGASNGATFGHVLDATLFLQCSIDGAEPYVATGGACDAPPNIPIIDEESNMGGIAAVGGVTIFGPDGDASASLYDITFAFTETHNRDGSVDFMLDSFSGLAPSTSYGSFSFANPSIRLAKPAHGGLIDEMVSFPAGTLRMEVTAAVTADGEVLFDGKPVSGEYVNSEMAIATRKVDGTFAFIEVPFEAGGYQFTLNTEDGDFQPQ